ncbi:hypothetical protein ACF0H5_013940 [Mactra antiquata]
MACGGCPPDKMSEEAYDFVCTSCDRENKTREAVKYCIECRGYCCQTCTYLHNKFLSLMNHNFIDASRGGLIGSQPTRLPEFPTERCSTHGGKVMDLYCKCHDSVGCVTCMATDHKSCAANQILSIPDMLNSLFNLYDSQQTQKRLRQMMVSLATLDESKDALLKTLNIAKEDAINQVEIFQNALHAVLRKVAESSRKEIEDAYNHLEKEILQDKQTLTITNNVLQDIDKKLDRSVANRAQRFVCTRVAKNKFKEAETMKQQMDDQKDVQLLFRPDHSLMGYIKDLKGIGDVQVITKKKHDLYKLRESKDVNMKLSDETGTCWCWDCCCSLFDNNIIVTDGYSRKLKYVDIQTLTVIQDCVLKGNPFSICCVNQNEVAVACCNPSKIQFVSIQNKIKPTRHFDMTHKCIGIATKADKLYVTDDSSFLYVYDMTGTLLQTISTDKSGNKVFTNSRHIAINESGNKMFVADLNNGLVCFDGEGNYLFTVKDNNLTKVCGVCVDYKGNVFVTGVNSHNVIQYTEKGKKIGVVVKPRDWICRPSSVCYHQGLNRLFVTQWKSDLLKMYELE